MCRIFRGGNASTSPLSTAEWRTSSRSCVCCGSSRIATATTQMDATAVSPPKTSPPSESTARRGERRRLLRIAIPAAPAPTWSRSASASAPTRPAIGVYGECAPPESRCGASRDPSIAPRAIAASESTLAASPRRAPRIAIRATRPTAARSIRSQAEATRIAGLRGRGSYGASGGVVQLVRTPACHAGGRGVRVPSAPASKALPPCRAFSWGRRGAEAVLEQRDVHQWRQRHDRRPERLTDGHGVRRVTTCECSSCWVPSPLRSRSRRLPPHPPRLRRAAPRSRPGVTTGSWPRPSHAASLCRSHGASRPLT